MPSARWPSSNSAAMSRTSFEVIALGWASRSTCASVTWLTCRTLGPQCGPPKRIGQLTDVTLAEDGHAAVVAIAPMSLARRASVNVHVNVNVNVLGFEIVRQRRTLMA